jgi:hypothetical protein
MSPISPGQPSYYTAPMEAVHTASEASPTHQAQQMTFISQFLLNIIIPLLKGGNPKLQQDLADLLANFSNEDNSSPNVTDMQNRLNQVIDELNRANVMPSLPHWDLNDNGGKPGWSFMHMMLPIMQFLDGVSNQDPHIHKWVSQLDERTQNGPWNAASIQKFINSLLDDAQHATTTLTNQAGEQLPGYVFLPDTSLPDNLFT